MAYAPANFTCKSNFLSEMHFCALLTDICNFEEQKWSSCSDKCFEILGRCNLRINRQQGLYDNDRELHRFIEREFSICIIKVFLKELFPKLHESVLVTKTKLYITTRTTARLFFRRKNSSPKCFHARCCRVH